MTRMLPPELIASLIAVLALTAAPSAAEQTPGDTGAASDGPADPWLRAAAYLDRDAVAPGQDFRVAVVLDIDSGFHVNATPPSLKFLVPTVVTPQADAAIRWGEVEYPPGQPLKSAWADGKTVLVYSGRTVITVRATAANDAAPGTRTLRLKLAYQGCNADTCFQPAERLINLQVRFVDAASPTRLANADLFVQHDTSRLSGAETPLRFEEQTDLASTLERSLAGYLAVLFLGGLVLNLTPCVFPLVPVTMTFFAQQGEHRPGRVLPLALAYVAGLAAAFTAVGVISALAGRRLGLVLQEPAGVLVVVVILAAMMASAFGAFEIRLPSSLAGRLGAKSGLLGAAMMGMVMGAVAAPCVGPFLFALITLVATLRSVALGAVSFFTTGLGLGAPYVLLGMFTGLINRFPRGAGWMIWVRRLMGLALAGLILYYVERFIDRVFLRLLVLALFAFAAVYLAVLEGLDRRPFTRRFWTVRLVAGAVILVSGIYVYGWVMAPRAEVPWQPWTPERFAKARTESRPILLYFGADWCIECKEWKARLFTDPAVIRASAPLALMYVDVTTLDDGPKKEFASRYQAINPPAVVILGPDGTIVAAYRSPPAPGRFIEAIRAAATRDHRPDTPPPT